MYTQNGPNEHHQKGKITKGYEKVVSTFGLSTFRKVQFELLIILFVFKVRSQRKYSTE